MEIESIFIEKEYRKSGQGGRLMESALKWFKYRNICDIKINVVYNNSDALPFMNDMDLGLEIIF